MKVDPLDTDATIAGRQRGRCDAQETWMPQAAASRTSSWPLAQPAATGRLPRAPRAVFSAGSPADSAEAACESLHKALLRKRGRVHALGGRRVRSLNERVRIFMR
jgi:hypothetical protein